MGPVVEMTEFPRVEAEPLRDMIVPLLALPDPAPRITELKKRRVVIRRARAWERTTVSQLADAEFSHRWPDEVACAWTRVPASAFVAFTDDRCVGFIAHSCAYPGVVGPMGVTSDYRRFGVGAALLLCGLQDLRNTGHLYGIIGAVQDTEFFARICGAIPLPAEWPNYMRDAD